MATPCAYARHYTCHCIALHTFTRPAAAGVPPTVLQVYSRALAGWGNEPSSMHGWDCALLWASSSASLMAAVGPRPPISCTYKH